MFNPAKLSEEIFGILRSFDYTVNIFDFEGNRVVEPSEARRFFATPRNITVSVHEDGENSCVRMFISPATEVGEIEGLISTMRITSSKFGLLFNVRKYQRDIKPKDLAPNAVSESFNEDTMDTQNLEEKKGPPTMPLPALGCEVEIDAWNDFKNGKLDVYAAPEEFTDDQAGSPSKLMVLRLKAVSRQTKADALSNMFSRVADAIEHGSDAVLNLSIAKQAIKLGYQSDNLEEEVIEEKKSPPAIHLPALDCDVEEAAWAEFKAGKLAMSGPVNFDVKLGATANANAFFLRQIAAKTNADLMSSMLSNVADDIENGRSDALRMAITKMAIGAARAGGQANVTEGLIATESIRDFGRWFDSMSADVLLENGVAALNESDEDDCDKACDVAYKAVEGDFSATAFLDKHGSDFGWGDDTLDEEDKTHDVADIRKSLVSYIQDELDSALETEYPSRDDVEKLADAKLGSVKTALKDKDYTLNEAVSDEDANDDDDDGNTELTSEDVLLPKNAADDLTSELTSTTPDSEVERLVSLSRYNPTHSRRAPQP